MCLAWSTALFTTSSPEVHNAPHHPPITDHFSSFTPSYSTKPDLSFSFSHFASSRRMRLSVAGWLLKAWGPTCASFMLSCSALSFLSISDKPRGSIWAASRYCQPRSEEHTSELQSLRHL